MLLVVGWDFFMAFWLNCSMLVSLKLHVFSDNEFGRGRRGRKIGEQSCQAMMQFTQAAVHLAKARFFQQDLDGRPSN